MTTGKTIALTRQTFVGKILSLLFVKWLHSALNCHESSFRCIDESVSSVAQSCPTLCGPRDCSTPGLPVHHQLLELAQTPVHRVGDAIQPSHPRSPPSPPAFSLSQHQGLFQELVLHIRWPKYWSFKFSTSPSNEYSGLISFRIDWFGTDCFPLG